jgi:hypothetical protein
MRWTTPLLLAASILLLTHCGSGETTPPEDTTTTDAGAPDDGTPFVPDWGDIVPVPLDTGAPDFNFPSDFTIDFGFGPEDIVVPEDIPDVVEPEPIPCEEDEDCPLTTNDCTKNVCFPEVCLEVYDIDMQNLPCYSKEDCIVGRCAFGVCEGATPTPEEPILVRSLIPFARSLSHGAAWGDGHLFVVSNTGLEVFHQNVSKDIFGEGIAPLPGDAYDIALSGNMAFIASSEGLQIVAVTSPSSPSYLNSLNLPGEVRYVSASSGRLFVSGNDGLLSLDVNNPLSPMVKDYWEPNAIIRRTYINGNFLYLVSPTLGFRVLDISDPANLVDIGSIDIADLTGEMTVLGDYAYMPSFSGTGTLHTVKVSNATDPSLINSMPIPGGAVPGPITSFGSTVVLATSGPDTVVTHYDVSNPANPTAASVTALSSHAKGLVMTTTNTFVVQSSTGVRNLNSVDPSNISVTEVLFQPGHAKDVAVSGGHAFIADGTGGLRVFNMENPYKLNQLETYDNGEEVMSVEIAGDLAYLSHQNSGFSVVDISDPDGIVEVASAETTFTVHALPHGDYIYLADYAEGIKVYELTADQELNQVGAAAALGIDFSLLIHDDYLYAANYGEGLVVYDISDPTTPILVENNEAFLIGAGSLAIHDNTLFVAASSVGIGVFDLTDPAHPLHLGTYLEEEGGNMTSVSVIEGLAYVTNQSGNLHIFDISDPTDLNEINRIWTPGTPQQVQGTKPYYVMPDGPVWMHVIQTGCETDTDESTE